MRVSVLYFLIPASLATYGGFLYYRLAWLHHQSVRALQHVDAQLNSHHQLLPHLILAIAQHAHHEREILDNAIKARRAVLNARTLEERMMASSQLSHALRHLFQLSEACSLLHMNDEASLIHMQVVLAEQKIALAREYYNHVTQHYNERISRFPHNLMAHIAGFERKIPFELGDHVGHSFARMEC